MGFICLEPVTPRPSARRLRLILALTIAATGALCAGPSFAHTSGDGAATEDKPKCTMVPLTLWGDGKHDDTAALNAWFRGDPVIWADTGDPVPAIVAGHDFRLVSAIYVPGGSGRTLEQFHISWPERHETLSGGTIATGTDPDKAPALADVARIGGDAGEGVPFDDPDRKPAASKPPENCFTS